MNTRRLSFGLLLTIAAMMTACGGEPDNAATPPQPTGAPTDAPSAPPTAAEVTPPATATAAPEPPPPAPKPAKEKFVGKFVQDFAGEVKDTADAAAKKAAGKADKDGKKYNAAIEKAQKAVADNTLENTADTFKWIAKGKTAHDVKYEVGSKADDPNNLTIKLGKDGKKDLKGAEVAITFKDDNTFEMKDPFAKDAKKAVTLVFKRQ